MVSKMRSLDNGGSRIGIVFNGSPLFTGDAGSGESEIRRWLIENDFLEAIVALPEQLFYNTGISTYIWILSNRKEKRRKGKVQLIDARDFWVPMEKSLGNKRRRIGDCAENGKDPDHIGDIAKLHGDFTDGDARLSTRRDAITHQTVKRSRVVCKVSTTRTSATTKSQWNVLCDELPSLEGAHREGQGRIGVQEPRLQLKKNEEARQAEIELGGKRQSRFSNS
jgi:type I restriction enzyme M protein